MIMFFTFFLFFLFLLFFFVSCLPVFEGPMEISWCCGVGVIPIVYFVGFFYLSWYGFVFFLVLLGGLLILFLYVSGLVPSVNYEFWYMFMLSLQMSILLVFVVVVGGFFSGICLFSGVSFIGDYYLIYDSYFFLFSLFLMIYLLVGLLIVGFFVDVSWGPMRKLIGM